MRCREALGVFALAAATALAAAGGARAETPPGVWDVAKDPAERDRWALHLKVQRLLDGPPSDDLSEEELDRAFEVRLQDARQKLEEAHAADSPEVALRFDLGIVYEDLGARERQDDLFVAAIGILEPALETAPDRPGATRAFAALINSYVYLGKAREELAASRRYLELITDGGARAERLMNMGEAEMRLGRLGDALATFRGVLQLCGALPNTIDRNLTYALALWDLAVALDRSGDARAALDTAAKARGLSWGSPGPHGQPILVTGWDAIRDHEGVFFVPDWEREWYLAIGNAAAARDEKVPRFAAALWSNAERHWASYAEHAEATPDAPWLPIARVRRDRAHAEALQAAARDAGAGKRGQDDGQAGGDHAL